MSKIIYVISGELVLISEMCIGTGEKEFSDKDIALDRAGKPYIPATSFIGKIYSELSSKNESLWGREQKAGKYLNESRIICEDLMLKNGNPRITVRDGIRMESDKGTVADKGKFDYQVVEPGISFGLNMELTATEEKYVPEIDNLISDILSILSNGIGFGASTSNGKGKVKLIDPSVSKYDLNIREHLIAKLLKEPLNNYNPIIKCITNDNFKITAVFHLENSLIIRSYNDKSSGPDSVHITSGGHPIVSGSSLKGALRARAERILNTLNPTDAESVNLFMAGLFGDITKDSDGKPLKNAVTVPSRISVTENIISNVASEQQTRIKIDQFTGGTIEGGLLDEMPVFQASDARSTENIHIDIEVTEPKDADMGLLLLILKDLWTGDLPLGGERSVGRGYLQGLNAVISIPDKTDITFTELKELDEKDSAEMDKQIALLQNIISQVDKARLKKYGYIVGGE